ncbi:hypothetical protein BJV78DRAFT_547156 [Lactifluus subvellereus]|nr:hypothetical protein BJV78DRAFT_547156 [Lactifluus subvellereus]
MARIMQSIKSRLSPKPFRREWHFLFPAFSPPFPPLFHDSVNVTPHRTPFPNLDDPAYLIVSCLFSKLQLSFAMFMAERFAPRNIRCHRITRSAVATSSILGETRAVGSSMSCPLRSSLYFSQMFHHFSILFASLRCYRSLYGFSYVYRPSYRIILPLPLQPSSGLQAYYIVPLPCIIITSVNICLFVSTLLYLSLDGVMSRHLFMYTPIISNALFPI